MRSDEIEDQISNELDARYADWRLKGVGEDEVWIAQRSTPHPDLVAWCAKWEFKIKEYGVSAAGEGPDVNSSPGQTS